MLQSERTVLLKLSLVSNETNLVQAVTDRESKIASVVENVSLI